MKKMMTLVLAILMLASLLTACGAADAPTNAPADAPTNAQTIVVGYTIYEPMNYFDDSGKLIGYDTELAEAVFGNLGLPGNRLEQQIY